MHFQNSWGKNRMMLISNVRGSWGRHCHQAFVKDGSLPVDFGILCNAVHYREEGPVWSVCPRSLMDLINPRGNLGLLLKLYCSLVKALIAALNEQTTVALDQAYSDLFMWIWQGPFVFEAVLGDWRHAYSATGVRQRVVRTSSTGKSLHTRPSYEIKDDEICLSSLLCL